MVLGVLPSVKLQLPDDPPGLLHAVSCLVEAVVSHPPQQQQQQEEVEQGGDSQEQQDAQQQAQLQQQTRGGETQQQRLQQQRQRQQGAGGAAGTAPVVVVRLTVFAAAGAVACWHEAPASLELPLAFSPLTKAPIWTSGWVPCPAALLSRCQQRGSRCHQLAKLQVQALHAAHWWFIC